MNVIFLDFDGVLNSEASVLVSINRRMGTPADDSPVNEDLCPTCTSNFQFVLDNLPDVKIVISSSWRLIFDIDTLKAKLKGYGIDSDRVVGITPLTHRDQSDRGDDISAWLADHPEVTDYAILDDMDNMTCHAQHLVLTDYRVGLSEEKAWELIQLLRSGK